jgi:hypothetical protein
MKFLELIREYRNDPASLEAAYRQAVKEHKAREFEQDLQTVRSEAPDNLLYSAWHYRLQAAADTARVILWKYALPLAFICGLIIFLLSDDRFTYIGDFPAFALFWSPVAGIAVLAYLALSRRQGYLQAGLLSLGLAAASLYAYFMVPRMAPWAHNPAGNLMAMHVPALSLAAVGVFVTGLRSLPQHRFAFLIKTLEATTTGGLSAIAIYVLALITIGLFSALDIELPEWAFRLMFAGGMGLVPVLAVSIVYDPLQKPGDQDFSQGLSKFIANLLRVMIVPTLIVAVLYTLFIPFNFMEPFQNRDVLFIYNGMLFAVILLLLGAIPVHPEELKPELQAWLRRAILMVAALAVLVSVYALTAILYRTFIDSITMNRMVVIGWNTINIVVLVLMIFFQFRHTDDEWALALKKALNIATIAYTAWAAIVVLAVPLIQW